MALYSDVLLRQSTLYSLDDYFGLAPPNEINYIQYAGDVRDSSNISPAKAPYLSIALRSSPYQQSTHRSYFTVAGLLSMLGCLWNVGFLIIGVVATMVNKRRFFVEVAQTINQLGIDHQVDSSHSITPNKPTELRNLNKLEKDATDTKRDRNPDDISEILAKNKNRCLYKVPKADEKAFGHALQQVAEEVDVLYVLTQIRRLQVRLNKVEKENKQNILNAPNQGIIISEPNNDPISGEASPFFNNDEHRAIDINNGITINPPTGNRKKSYNNNQLDLHVTDKFKHNYQSDHSP